MIDQQNEQLNQHLIRCGLSKREREIAILAGLGSQTARELGAQLFIEPRTIRFHLTRIYKKLGFKRRGELQFMIGTFGKDVA